LSHILHQETPVAVLQNITEKAAKDALQPATNQAAFRNTGLWPFDSSKIRANTRLALTIPEKPSSEDPNEMIITHTSNVMKHLLKVDASVKQQKVSGMPEKNKLILEKSYLTTITRKKNMLLKCNKTRRKRKKNVRKRIERERKKRIYSKKPERKEI
jgi:hypothetical protein